MFIKMFCFTPIRKLSLSSLSKKSHYETLGVTPNATMADIKKAYYNLTMVYHPDKSDGSEAALTKFREISEAYEVLGNINSKKLYDKGVFRSPPVQTKTPKSTSKKVSFVPQHSGRTTIYDFDQWTRAHYGDSVLRRAAAKQRFTDMERSKVDERADTISVNVMLILIGILSLGMLFVEISGNANDKPSKDIDKSKSA